MIEDFQHFITPNIKNSTFSCIRCGRCCKFSEIILSNREIRIISNYLNIPIKKFKEKYLLKKEIHTIQSIFSNKFKISGEVLILKKNDQNLCPFYKEVAQKTACQIYNFRPIVCRLFPFTWEISESNPNLMKVAIDFSQNGCDECPGINHITGKSWKDISNEIIGAVFLSIIQSNELITDGYLTRISK